MRHGASMAKPTASEASEEAGDLNAPVRGRPDPPRSRPQSLVPVQQTGDRVPIITPDHESERLALAVSAHLIGLSNDSPAEASNRLRSRSASVKALPKRAATLMLSAIKDRAGHSHGRRASSLGGRKQGFNWSRREVRNAVRADRTCVPHPAPIHGLLRAMPRSRLRQALTYQA